MFVGCNCRMFRLQIIKFLNFQKFLYIISKRRFMCWMGNFAPLNRFSCGVVSWNKLFAIISQLTTLGGGYKEKKLFIYV